MLLLSNLLLYLLSSFLKICLYFVLIFRCISIDMLGWLFITFQLHVTHIIQIETCESEIFV